MGGNDKYSNVSLISESFTKSILMNYKKWLPWIFIAFILLLTMMWATESEILIGIGIILAPFLLVWQAYIILKSDEKTEDTFDDKWYEK